MGIRNIRKYGDEVLRKTSKPVEVFNERLQILIEDMKETMCLAEGVGLAAPQIGVLKRVAVIDIGEGFVELINPEILYEEGEVVGREACLSVPGLLGEVARPEKVKVSAQDVSGKPFEFTGEGLLARAICHEIDHLDGILYIDKVIKFIDSESDEQI